jgi:hypothetical protein
VQFQKMRANALARRQPDAQRERIMREFEQVRPSAFRPPLRWALGMAAVLLLAVALGQVWRSGPRSTGPAKNPIRQFARIGELGGGRPTVSASGNMGASGQDELIANDDFAEVPYASAFGDR